jgi:recombinational DNA repair ATPase RecF
MSPPAPDDHADGRWRGRMEEKVDQLKQLTDEDRRVASKHRHDIRETLHLQDNQLAEVGRDVKELKKKVAESLEPVVKELRDDKLKAKGAMLVIAAIGSGGAALAVWILTRIAAHFFPGIS